MWIPIILFCLLLLGAVATAVLSRRAPKFVGPTAVAVTGMALLLWLFLRGQFPYSVPLFSGSDSALLPAFVWMVDEITWPVTFWLLLLLLVTLAVTPSSNPPSLHAPILFVFTAVTLASIWASSIMGMMIGWLLLLLVWTIVSGWLGSKQFLWQIGLLLTAVLLLWLGAASAPVGFEVTSWATRTVTIVILAAILQIGIWPFAGWRPTATNLPVSLALWLVLVPAISGGVLLLRILPDGIGLLPGQGILLTLASLFGLLQAIRRAWARLHLPAALAAFMSVALVHLFVLTAVWGTTEAALAMLQLFILGSGILYLAAGRPLSRSVWWRWLAPIMVLAAIAGLPLTVGLSGHLPLYEGFLDNGRFILLFVLVFLQMPLLTAGMRLFWPEASEEEGAVSRESVFQDAAVLLLALGLFSVEGLAWNGQWLPWLAILLVPVGGLVLYRFTPEFRRTTVAVRQAFIWRRPFRDSSDSVKKLASGIGEAFREAAAILEGDGSLLWLLALILILLLVR